MDEGLTNWEDLELDMMSQILGYRVNFTCYCILIVCSQPMSLSL